MPKPTLEELYSLPDPMFNDNFDLLFTNVPGGGDGRQLRIQCLSAALPGATIQTAEVELFGHKLIYGARKTFSHNMTVGLHEIYDARTYQTLKNWAAQVRATRTQTGQFSSNYASIGTLTIYDPTGAQAAQWRIHRMFPTEIGEYSLEGTGGQALSQQAQFAYGWVERA